MGEISLGCTIFYDEEKGLELPPNCSKNMGRINKEALKEKIKNGEPVLSIVAEDGGKPSKESEMQHE